MQKQASETGAANTLALNIDAAVACSGLGRTTIFNAIRAGDLKAKKAGHRIVILTEDFRAWLTSRPDALDDRQDRLRRGLKPAGRRG